MKKTAKNNGTRKLILPPPGTPPSALGRKLRRLRKEIEESGEKLLTSAEVDREVRRRRGLEYSEVVKKGANSYRTVELPPPGAPVSALGRKLTRLRKKIEESGEKLLTREEVNREVRRRRGLA